MDRRERDCDSNWQYDLFINEKNDISQSASDSANLVPSLANQLREQLLPRIDVEMKRELAVLVYLQSINEGRSLCESSEFAGKLVGVTPRTVRRWLDAVIESRMNDHSAAAAVNIDALIRHDREAGPQQTCSYQHHSTQQPQQPQHPQYRKWLLEDHPELLERAKIWLATQWARVHADGSGRPFKITEFQQFVNNELIRPLFDHPDHPVQPISHSTARSWLKRLGYYEEKRKLEADGAAAGCGEMGFIDFPMHSDFGDVRHKRTKTWPGPMLLLPSRQQRLTTADYPTLFNMSVSDEYPWDVLSSDNCPSASPPQSTVNTTSSSSSSPSPLTSADQQMMTSPQHNNKTADPPTEEALLNTLIDGTTSFLFQQ